MGNHLPCGSFFPAAAKIRELVWPLIADEVDRFAAFRRVATAVPTPTHAREPEPERVPPSEKEREHVRRVAAEVKAELTASAERLHGRKRVDQRKSDHISDGALLALYEKMGPAGHQRIEMLRAKLDRKAIEE